ncbi:MAG: LPS export ABC transporter permease LptF, partial [Pseudomonadota bacterium]
LVTIVPLGVYLGVVLALGRLNQDSEMIVMAACGMGLRKLYRPIVAVGLVGLCITAVLTVYVSPWAKGWQHEIEAQSGGEGLAGLVQAGRFVESDGGDVVLFAGEVADNGRLQDVFMRQVDPSGDQVVEIARSARYQIDEDSEDQFLVFLNGERTTLGSRDRSYNTVVFEKHGVRVPRTQTSEAAQRRSAQSTASLSASPHIKDRAEFHWRIGIPLAALVLAFLAVPVAHSAPRKGRFSKIAIAILIYIVYTNLLVLARKWIAAGQMPEILGLWWVHVALALVTLVLLHYTYGLRFTARNRTA